MSDIARGRRKEERERSTDETPTPDEKVDAASIESFPASDPPGWFSGGCTPAAPPREEVERGEPERRSPVPRRVRSPLGDSPRRRRGDRAPR